MEERTLRTLEYDKILAQIAQYSFGAKAKETIMNLRPLNSMEEITDALNKVEEADKILFKYAANPSTSIDNIEDALNSAAVMSMLTMSELLKIGRALRIARALRTKILGVPDESIVLLKDMAKTIYINKKLEEDIDRAILSDTEMHDNASPELRSIRVKIRKMGENIKAKLYNYVNSPAYAKYMQDNIITIRNDRYVVPLKAEYKGAIPGLVHDQSSSGATLYVEPFVIVEMNNDLKQLILDEQSEIERILREFTFRISSEVELIRYTFDVITDLDVIFAKAYYANSINGVKPIINNEGKVDIKNGRHPLINEKKVIPNDIRVGDDFKMLLITGPNTGGKTVCLKLIGIIELLGLTGIFVPAEYAEIAFFDNIYSDIGDEQSIEQNLSTFSSHMNNVVNIVNGLTDNCLVLLDELGAGTDPTEGAALALSITQYIMQIGAKAVITTHYNEFKEFAVITPGAQNASMDFDPTTYSPTYKLRIGAPGASNALLIAEKLGLKKEIIEGARKSTGKKNHEFENVLLSLEKSRKEAEENLLESQKIRQECEKLKLETEKEREKLFNQREKLNVSVKRETKRLVDEAMLEVNEIVDELRNLLDNPTDADLFRAQKLRKSLKKYVIIEDNEFVALTEEIEGAICVGDRVLVKTLNAEGEVVEINASGTDAKVRLGNMTCNAKMSTLQRLKPKQKKENMIAKSTRVLHNESVSPEINLIGKNSMEAEEMLSEYIDKCLRASLREIRIIHGYGEGILRKMVQKHLKARKEIESYRDGQYNEGGKGVTIAYLK